MKASNFKEYLLTQVNNHSLYVWGGQGEVFDRMNMSSLREMETDPVKMANVLTLYAHYISKGFDMKDARCYDCSGLGVYFFVNNGIINSDMTADGLYKVSKPISLNEVKEGDFVFKNKSSSGKWGHIGYVVYDEGLKVVEAKGRLHGVVKSALTSWEAAARPTWWEKEIFRFNRNLKPGMKGEDVKALQELLGIKADGDFGAKTTLAVKEFQKKHKLEVDGIAGKNTIKMLGGEWG